MHITCIKQFQDSSNKFKTKANVKQKNYDPNFQTIDFCRLEPNLMRAYLFSFLHSPILI